MKQKKINIHFFHVTLFSILLFLISCGEQKNIKPNFIIIYCDDLGYGDIGPYGNKVHRTPNLDRMAAEGVVFTDFYVTSGVCSPSRSSLMTGSYAQRVDMHVNARPWGSVGRQVLFPKAQKGLNPNEITIAEILKEQGYSTACIGKWHLGDQPDFLPTKQGFDYYYGIPYSNDMNRDYCPLPLMKGEIVIEAPVDQNTITKRYTEEVISFIDKNKDKPFFVYLPHAMTHNPLHAGEEFRGKSANGIYGDAVEEIDWSTGQILDYLKEIGIEKNTMVVFSSDNGAASRFGGTNQPLSGWKGSTMEGGMRVPGIFWWPETLKPLTVENSMATTMDLLPTIAYLAEGKLPVDRILDGYNIFDLMNGESTKSPYNAFYYYQLEQLQAIRLGPWKLHLPLDSMYGNFHTAQIVEGRPMALYNLEVDIKETNNISAQHPEIVDDLLKEAEKARQALGDFGIIGNEVRPAAIVENPVPQLMN
jgi:arylsulfatase A-like enzyme